MKRFLKVFLFILLYFVFWSIILFVGILVIGQQNEMGMVVFALVSLGVIFITFIPFLNMAMKFGFTFKSNLAALPIEEVKKRILKINQLDIPIMVKKEQNKMVITWKYVDARWWEIFSHAGLQSVYELHLKFKPQSNKVILIDVTKSVDWHAGPTEVELRANFFRGIVSEISIGKAYGIKENFELGKIYDFKFNPAEVKTPVLNELLKSGWDVQFSMW